MPAKQEGLQDYFAFIVFLCLLYFGGYMASGSTFYLFLALFSGLLGSTASFLTGGQISDKYVGLNPALQKLSEEIQASVSIAVYSKDIAYLEQTLHKQKIVMEKLKEFAREHPNINLASETQFLLQDCKQDFQKAEILSSRIKETYREKRREYGYSSGIPPFSDNGCQHCPRSFPIRTTPPTRRNGKIDKIYYLPGQLTDIKEIHWCFSNEQEAQFNGFRPTKSNRRVRKRS